MEVTLKSVEVVLKKTKITKSILNQSSVIRVSELFSGNFEPIGWCRLEKGIEFVFYKNNKLFRCKYFTQTRLVNDNILKRIFNIDEEDGIGVGYEINGQKFAETFSVLADAESFEKTMNSIHKTIMEKGQFYL